jgi:hypothetical protein
MTVMLFAVVVALSLLAMAPLPVISMMGGVRLTESERVLLDVACAVQALAILTFPVWLLGYLGTLAWPRRAEEVERTSGSVREIEYEHDEQTRRSVPRVNTSVWIFAVLTLLAGFALLPMAQHEQQLRQQVESALRGGEVKKGIEVMSRHRRSDFPPHWDPPPRIGYRERTPPMIDVLEALAQTDAPDWVRATFIDKILLQSQSGFHGEFEMLLGTSVLPHPPTLDDAGLARYHRILSQLPDGPAIAAAQRDPIENSIKYAEDDRPLTAERQELLEALLDLAGPDEDDAN